ncbi:hypothetical protein C8R45DRAFT_1162169 [Mycena sanguinolenta]|nr:hypothetical protein C8R45DRAFT_1162169 [Mycena sanguinolenta]
MVPTFCASVGPVGVIIYETWLGFDDKSLFAYILSVLAMTYSDTQPRGTERQPLHLKIPHNTCFQAILNSGMHTEGNVAKGVIGEYVDNNKSVPLKMSAIMGLGLAYAGSHREDRLQFLIPHISDDVLMDIASLATLALGFIFVGSENGEITGTILQTLMEKAERSDTGINEKWARYMALSLGLLYIGLQDPSDTTIKTLMAIEHLISKTAQIVVEAGRHRRQEPQEHVQDASRGHRANVNSAHGNLAGPFVNAFVNVGFGNDKLMVQAEENLFNVWFPSSTLFTRLGISINATRRRDRSSESQGYLLLSNPASSAIK